MALIGPGTWTTLATTSANQNSFSDTTALPNTAYNYRIRAFNEFRSGSYSPFTNIATATTGSAPTTGTGDGLLAQYFTDLPPSDNVDPNADNHLQGTPVLTRLDPTPDSSSLWPNSDPDGDASALTSENFSLRWTAKLQPQFSETYTLTTTADDGVRLYLNNQLLIDNFVDQAPTSRSATLPLIAGQLYDLRVEYYQHLGGAALNLQWSSPSTLQQTIPTSQLYSGIAPAAPTNLTLTPAASIQINLAWTDNANNETGYIVERQINSAPFTQIASLPPNSTAYSDTELTPATAYTYRVKATNYAQNSPYTTATLTTPIPPNKPTNASATLNSPTSLTLTWTDTSDNEDGFRISRALLGGTFIVIAQLPPNTQVYTDTNVQEGKTYEYHIQSYNVAGYNDFTGVQVSTPIP
jgi:hypothetical protein